MNRPLRCVKCRCQQPPTIFQAKKSNVRVDITYPFIEDMMSATNHLKFKDAIDYCEANGLDIINIMKYYNIVQSLERIIKKT